MQHEGTLRRVFALVQGQPVVAVAHVRDEGGGQAQTGEREREQEGPGEPLQQGGGVRRGEASRRLLQGVPQRPYAGGGLHLLAQGVVVAHVGVELGLGALGTEPGLLLNLGALQLVRAVHDAQLVDGEGGEQDGNADGGEMVHKVPHGATAARCPAALL